MSLRSKVTSFESCSYNLIVLGVKKPVKDTAASGSVKSIFIKSFSIEQDTGSSMVFTRCNRLPQAKSAKNTPVKV